MPIFRTGRAGASNSRKIHAGRPSCRSSRRTSSRPRTKFCCRPTFHRYVDAGTEDRGRDMTERLEIKNLYKIFSDAPGPALEMLAKGSGKSEVFEKLGVVVGLNNVS